MKKLIECVPNFSEGRDPSFLPAIARAVTANTETELWDQSSDRDHNRSVFTMAGSPESLELSVMQFVKEAASHIDMRNHTGVHPCIGATDVIPFIPLSGADMQDCIFLAERVGQRIAKEYGIPVYLYARAARVNSHRRLADLRRGGYSKLQEEIAITPERFPDFGPHTLGSAGACAVGARDFLIAFNIFLDTSDVSSARSISRVIRESSGGMKGVQAIGFQVDHKAQVSMNILDYHSSPLATVYKKVEQLADGMNIHISHSELIGLLPRDALTGTTAEELRIKNFSEDRIIENHY